MKFCLSHKKYLLAGIYIICVIFTCFNARFYHTPLAKICSVSEMETMSREGTRGAEEHYYTQKITARILNGAYKGKEITLSNEYTSSQVQTQKYHKGDTVLLNGSKDRPDYSSDLYYEKTGGLYDRISDTEYIDFCVRISTFGRWKEYSENM